MIYTGTTRFIVDLRQENEVDWFIAAPVFSSLLIKVYSDNDVYLKSQKDRF